MFISSHFAKSTYQITYEYPKRHFSRQSRIFKPQIIRIFCYIGFLICSFMFFPWGMNNSDTTMAKEDPKICPKRKTKNFTTEILETTKRRKYNSEILSSEIKKLTN
ncbi:hypothetical protein U1Q18_029453 [Sarracenia purpurea var. burkii]